MILLDMDGVFVDFVAGVLKIDPTLVADNWSFFPSSMWQLMDFDFWYHLPWTKDGVDLLQVAEAEAKHNHNNELVICTSPCATRGCMDGKWAWIKDNMPSRFHKNVIFCPADKGYLAHDKALLIDDHAKNVDSFIKHGGQGCLVPREWNDLKHRQGALLLSTVVDQLQYPGRAKPENRHYYG